MTETRESAIEPSAVARPSRLGQVVAWVAIVAGVVFVVAVIFFSGLFLGLASGSHYGWHRGYDDARDGSCPMMGSGRMMGPGGMMWPGGMMGPQQTPGPSTSPSPRP